MSVDRFPPKAPLDRRYRAALALTQFLGLIHVMPSSEKAGSIPMAKRLAMKPAGWLLLPPSGSPRVEDGVVTGRHGDVPVRVYRPEHGAVAPVAVLYVHCGGWTVGGLDSLDWFCRELAVRGGHAVVSVQYRLAPDFAYPIPLDDVSDALAWLADNLAELGATDIAVAGDSAGGNLAAGAVIRATRDGGPSIRNQILIYPGLDATSSSPSMSDKAGGLTRADIDASWANYLGAQDPENPEVSPLLASSKAGLPDTLIITADHDVLRDDGRLYAQSLEDAGVTARWVEYPGVDHGFLSVPALAKRASLAATDEVLAALRVSTA